MIVGVLEEMGKLKAKGDTVEDRDRQKRVLRPEGLAWLVVRSPSIESPIGVKAAGLVNIAACCGDSPGEGVAL